MIECNENEKIVVDGVTYYKPIVKPVKKTGWEAPEENELMYSITTRRESSVNCMGNFRQSCEEDVLSLERANSFADKDFAKQYARHETLWRRIAKWQAENDEPASYKKNNNRLDFFIYYDYEIQMIGYYTYPKPHKYSPNAIAFSSAAKCMECIEAFRKELEWDMNEFKWRLDGE